GGAGPAKAGTPYVFAFGQKSRSGRLGIGHWAFWHSLVIGHWSLVISSFCCATAFASDFSGPLQDVQASINGNVVNYQVYDPAGGFIIGSTTNAVGPLNPITSGGVVTWLAGQTVNYQIYDPGRGRWIG